MSGSGCGSITSSSGSYIGIRRSRTSGACPGYVVEHIIPLQGCASLLCGAAGAWPIAVGFEFGNIQRLRARTQSCYRTRRFSRLPDRESLAPVEQDTCPGADAASCIAPRAPALVDVTDRTETPA